MTIAQDFKSFIDSRGGTTRGQRQLAVEAARWLATHDPQGTGKLAPGGLMLEFTDGSRCLADPETGRILIPN